MIWTATEIALVALVLFIILLLVLKVPEKIFGALDSQSQAIAKELSEANRLRVEAEGLKALYEAQLASAEAQAQELVAAAKAQAKVLADEAQKNLKESIERREAQAKDRIAQAEAHAETQVRAAAADAAIAAAEKILHERMNAGAQSALVAAGAAELAKSFG